MIKAIGLFVLIFASQGLIAQKDHIKTAEIKTQIWCDHCNECDDCGKNIFLSVKKNKGIKDVTVKDAENLISVVYNSKKVTLEEIENAIASAGFKANDIDADPEAYKNLDACCKKN